MSKRAWPQTRVCVVCGDTYTLQRRPGAHPITCSEECRRKRRNQKIAKWRTVAVCPASAHGTITGYNTYQCACSLCSRAERIYMQDRRAQIAEADAYALVIENHPTAAELEEWLAKKEREQK